MSTPARVRTRLPWLIPPGRTPTVETLTLALVIAGVAWRVLRYALAFPFWGDESFVTVNFITRDFAGMLRPLEWGQIAPPGFMWASLAVARVFGVGEWALRLVPLLAGVASLLLFWRLAASLLPPRATMIAVGCLAASFYAVRHGAEAKPYSTDLLTSLGFMLLALGVRRRPRSFTRWAALVVLAGAGPWCSYPSVFVAGAVGVMLALLVLRARGAWPAFAGLTAYTLVLGASSYFMVVLVAAPHAAAASRLMDIPMWVMAFPPWSEPGAFVGWLVLMHTGMMFAYPHGGHVFGSVGTFAAFVVGIIWMRRRPALLVLLLTPFVLTFAAASFEKYPYGGSVRTSLYLAPAICLLAGAGAWRLIHTHLKGEQRRLALLVAAGGLAALCAGGMIGDIAHPYATDHSRESDRIMRDIAARTRPADRWVAFNAVEPSAHAPWLGDWFGTGGQWVFDMLRMNPTRAEVRWAPPPAEIEKPADGRLWFFVYRGVRVGWAPSYQRQLSRYLDELTNRYGPPVHEFHVIKERDGRAEAVEVYRWE